MQKVTVRDTGIGMTPEEQSRVFKRFSQANNRMSKVSICLYILSFFFLLFILLCLGIRWIWVRSGSIFTSSYENICYLFIYLLLLYLIVKKISRKLAKLMKGTITLQSEKGVGSTFLVTVLCEREKVGPPRSASFNSKHKNENRDSSPTKEITSISTSQILQANSTVAHFSTQNHDLPLSASLIKVCYKLFILFDFNTIIESQYEETG